MRFLLSVSLIFLVAGFLAAQPKIITEQLQTLQKPWTSLEVNDDNFQFVVVTDRTGGNRPGIFETGVAKINLIQPEFVVSVGDLIQGYTQDTAVLERQWREFNGFIDQFEMPFFYVAGNHDYTNEVMAKMWNEKFGTAQYYFLYKNVLFLCLNSEDGATALQNPDIGDEQLAYAKAVLTRHPDVRWTMVFMHQPLWIRPSAKNWRELESVLDGRKHSVFTGHVHRYTLYERNKSDYFTLATMGGGTPLRGTRYGEFDHFMWVTMTETGPYYANILLDGIHDKSIYTQAQLAKRQAMDANPPIRLQPVFQDAAPVDRIVFSVENRDSVKRLAKIALNEGAYMKPTSLTSVAREIEPNSILEIEVPVALTGPVDMEAEPLSANVELLSEDFGWNKAYQVFPNPKLELAQASGRITVDGDLSEWRAWPFQFGEEGQRVRFSIKEIDQTIYFAAEVEDLDYQTGFGKGLLDQDGIILAIDPRPIAQSAYNPNQPEGVMKGEWVALAGQPTADDFELGYRELLPAGAQGKGKRTANGYQVEFAIPIAVLEKMRGGKLTDLRVNVSVIDADLGKRRRQYSWMPAWGEGYIGTGTFFRK